MTILETISRAHYAATVAQVEQLAHLVSQGTEAGTVYLRIMLVRMQSKLGRARRGKQPPQEPVLDAIHEELYPHVLKGVGPEDMPQLERNSKATFARSMASTVRYFIQNGGDVRGVDAAVATKTGLRKAVTPDAPAPEGETRTQRSFRRNRDALVKSAQRMARSDPDAARESIEKLMDELEAVLNSLDGQTTEPADHSASTTIVGGRVPGRVSSNVPAQLHRSA